MINIKNQIDYWRNSSENDYETAEILISSKKEIQGLFFCHLSVEKILKALIVRETGQIPPRSHDLFYLAKLADIEVDSENQEHLQILMKYQLEGRYPELYPVTPPRKSIDVYLKKTREILEWVKTKL